MMVRYQYYVTKVISIYYVKISIMDSKRFLKNCSLHVYVMVRGVHLHNGNSILILLLVVGCCCILANYVSNDAFTAKTYNITKICK